MVAIAASASAQVNRAAKTDSTVDQPPGLEVSLGYVYLHANAPPGSCQCFSLNGGDGAVSVNLRRGFSIVGDISAAHADNIADTTQSLTIFNYLFGPRYTLRRGSGRFAPYGQVLLGGSTESSSVQAVQSASAFAFSLGGGLNARLTHRLGWDVVQADWLHSQLPNGVNNRQNDLRIGSGIILRF